jgi:hypothetical protein
MICALKLGRSALFVVRHRQPERRNAQAIKNTAQLYVAFRLCVPLRHDQNGSTARCFPAGRGKEAGAGRIILH